MIGREIDDYSDEIRMLMALKTCIDNGHFFPEGKYLYCVSPWMHFYFCEGRKLLEEGDIMFASKTQFCTKTDGSHVGCWRTIARDKIVKSETGKILGFKKFLKFCPVNDPPQILKLSRKHGPRFDDRFWVMEEYRLAKKSKEHKVVCRMRVIYAFEVDDMLRIHMLGY